MRALFKTGKSILARIAIIAITTNNSISVKFLFIFLSFIKITPTMLCLPQTNCFKMAASLLMSYEFDRDIPC